MLEATIGLNEVEAYESSEALEETAEGPFTHNDLTFLKSLRISLTGEDSADGTIEEQRTGNSSTSPRCLASSCPLNKLTKDHKIYRHMVDSRFFETRLPFCASYRR